MSLWLPLMAIYNYDDTILDGLILPAVSELPAGVEYVSPIEPLSVQNLKQKLLLDLGELCPVYGDPEILKKQIEIWAAINKPNWLQLWATTLYKYNPIWNKDGSYTETRDLSTSTEAGETVSAENSQTSSANGSSTGNTTHSVTGYDTNALSPAYADSSTGSETQSGTLSGTAGSTSSSDEDHTEHETITRIERGNIGVTTTQAMIKEQREIVEFNIYDFIIQSFKNYFMIKVWDI